MASGRTQGREGWIPELSIEKQARDTQAKEGGETALFP